MLAEKNPNYHYITEQEYLDGEKLSETKHEYIDGQVYGMAGSSKNHNRITLNIAFALRLGAKGSLCDVYSSDIKVRVKNRKAYYYPDVVVGCDESDDADHYYLEKPCLIVEVLSPSTERKDATEKLLAYQNLASLQSYLLVDQSKYHISLIYPHKKGQWEIEYYTDLDDVITLSCPKMELLLSDVYEAISFELPKD